MEKLTVFDVATAFLFLGPQTPKKLQKLCYYAYAWHLAFTGEKLFDDQFEAWVHGPVNPSLYQKYKDYGWQEIPKIQDFISPDLYGFVNNVYDVYGKYDGNQLESLTHQEDPWIKARDGLPVWASSDVTISDEDIQSYYRPMLEEN